MKRRASAIDSGGSPARPVAKSFCSAWNCVPMIGQARSLRAERLGDGVAPAGAARVGEDPVARARGDDVRAAEGARGEHREALRGARPGRNASARIASACDSGSACVVERRSGPARSANSGSFGTNWMRGPRRVRVAGPRALDVLRRGEAADGPPARAPQDEVDRAPVLVGGERLDAARLEQTEDLRAAAEAEERRDPLAHGRRELPHPAAARVAQGVPVPALGVLRVRPRLAGVVPVVGAAQHRDGRRAALLRGAGRRAPGRRPRWPRAPRRHRRSAARRAAPRAARGTGRSGRRGEAPG